MDDDIKIISNQLDFSVIERDDLLCFSEDIQDSDVCNQLKSLLLVGDIDKFCLQLEKQKTSHIVEIVLKFVSEGLEKGHSAPQLLNYQKKYPSLSPFVFLEAAKSLIDNCFFKDEFAVSLENSLLFCLTSPKSIFSLNSYCCLLKDVAADMLSGLIKKYKSMEQKKKVIESIKGTFKIKEPPSIHYGAIVLSLSLGIDVVIEVIPEAFKDICDLYNTLPKEDPMKVWKASAWELKLKEKILYSYKQMVDYTIKYESGKESQIAPLLSKIKDCSNYFGDDLFTLKCDSKGVEPAKWKFIDLLLDEKVMKC